MDPRNAGVMDNPDLIGHAGMPGIGAFMILFLRVRDDRIWAARYHTVGCGPTIGAGSMRTELIVGLMIRLKEAVAAWEQVLRLAAGDGAECQELMLAGRTSIR